jgi:hypothetical protein
MRSLVLLAVSLCLPACDAIPSDLGYGVPYTVQCDTGEVFHHLDFIHGANSFDPNGSHGFKYVTVTLNGKVYREYVGHQCDWWPELGG